MATKKMYGLNISLADELRAGDVVLVKSSYGAGLWRLGDLLTGADA